jgi:hypothetical protein
VWGLAVKAVEKGGGDDEAVYVDYHECARFNHSSSCISSYLPLFLSLN